MPVITPPDWYLTLVACDRLHCAPWELDDDPDGWPFTWRARAIMARGCENEAENIRQQQQQASQRR